ncbi:MAG: hypothetical protein QF886_14815, partial [Planctomycetota bacterium]|nr:hypothetical protein [Planctomycetota bacterium]
SLAGEEARVSSTRKNDELVIDGRLLTCYGLGAAMTNQVSNTEVKTTEPPKGNLIGNGSFEIGFSRGWTARSKFGILNEQHLDGTTSKHGNFSLCTRNAKDETILNPIHSGAIHIAAQGLYTLSAWVKTQTPGRISLGLVPVKGRRAVLSKAATSQTEWQRISVTGQLKSGEYYVSISGGHFWLDGVQLEPGGKASEFQQRVPVSAGVLSDLPGNVYFEGENERPKLLVYADESLKKSKVTVRCRVYDIWGSETIEKKIRVPLKKNRAELDAGFLPDRLGSFRAELSVDGFPNSETEFVFSILPKPRTMGIDRHSWLATMPESKEYVLASLQRAGFKWMQNIRDTQVARWMYAEPEQGKIVWHDKLVSRSRRHGIEPVILLHVNYNRLPKWVKPTAANKNVPQDVSLWKRFVTRMVDHYKGQVKYWQLSDDIHHYFTADEYAMLLKATWEAAKKADPDCVVIGWRFFNREVPGWEEAFKKTEPYSDIIYAGDKQLRQKYGKQLHSYRFISAPTMYNFPALGAEARLASLAKGRPAACTGLVRAFCVHAESVGYVDALFYYMAYLGTPSYVTNRSKQTFEHCGSIHLGAVTLRMLDHFLYRMECLGNISLSKAVAAYHFRRGNDSCVVAWSTEGQKVALNFSERLTGLNVFNAMGNPIKPDRRRGRTTLSLYDTPIFISGKAVSPDRMATLFKNVDSKLELAV